MTNVLGYPLAAATALLEREGFAVESLETRSKTGAPEGTDARVVRQTRTERGVLLLFSVFKTELSETNA